ncbi:hypothetical protein SEA_ABT2GRADUATEX2_48 [Streptomyces phage Abt2graduatex2]|nr:hypothetical protein SEA_ABT2GRADUATEX2_48 [Streptomyces phage Abt2graduatex2]
MARNYAAELKDLIENAEANGWTYIGNNTVRRMAEHETPEFAQKHGWWTSSTYASLEFLSFVFPRVIGRVPKVVYGTNNTPWTARRDRTISYRRAVELLAEPIHLSETHNH